jgi:hypothetical protein
MTTEVWVFALIAAVYPCGLKLPDCDRNCHGATENSPDFKEG